MESQDIRQRTSLAGGSGAQGAACRLRHRLCLRRHGLPALRIPAAGVESRAPMPTAAASQTACASCGELLEVTHEAVGGKCAVALRISLEELRGRPSECAPPKRTKWSSCWPTCRICGTSRWIPRRPTVRPSRFTAEGSHEPIIEFVKKITTQAGGRRGALHLARHHGRADPARRARSDRAARGPRSPIRFCRTRSTRGASRTSASASAATSASPAGTTACRCAARRTRPSARSGAAAGTRSASRRPRSDASVLIVGGGPCRPRVRADARPARLRGHASRRPRTRSADGCASRRGCRDWPRWGRVLDWRRGQLERLPNVNLYRGNRLVGRRDPRARQHPRGDRDRRALGAHAVFAARAARGRARRPERLHARRRRRGAQLEGPVVVFDFDNYYMGSAARRASREGRASR